MPKRQNVKKLRSIPLNDEQRQLIVNRRKELGLTQQKLANKLGCLQLSVSNIERGKHEPRPEMLDKICRMLGLEWDVSVFVYLRPKN